MIRLRILFVCFWIMPASGRSRSPDQTHAGPFS
jgi:hypothetical protein